MRSQRLSVDSQFSRAQNQMIDFCIKGVCTCKWGSVTFKAIHLGCEWQEPEAQPAVAG